MRKVNYYWRIVATGFCFSCFGIGGLGLTIIVFPILQLLPLKAENKIGANQTVIHLTFRFFVWLMQTVGVLKLEVINREKLETDQGRLIIANHPSLIDVVVLISLLKRTNCVVKQGLWENPFLRGAVSAAGYISNSDPEGLIKDCVSSLDRGQTLIIFPEGTRTSPGKPLRFHRGAAHMAICAAKDITPVIILATPGALGKGDKWYQVPREGQFNLSVKVDENIDVKPFVNLETDYKTVQIRRLNEHLQNYYQEVLFTHE